MPFVVIIIAINARNVCIGSSYSMPFTTLRAAFSYFSLMFVSYIKNQRAKAAAMSEIGVAASRSAASGEIRRRRRRLA